MYALLLKQLRSSLSTLDSRLSALFGIHKGSSYQDSLNWNYCPSTCDPNHLKLKNSSADEQSILNDIIGSGFLWAVQTHRRSLEKRLSRKNAVEKHRRVNRKLIPCNVCGHFHEVHTICGNCYSKVQEETKAIQQAMADKWQMDPVDKDVVVLYKNDQKVDKEFWNGKRIVEIDRERPLWFHENLKVKCKTPATTDETSLQNPKTILSQIK